MNKLISMVREFMECGEQPISNKLTDMSEERTNLRLDLIEEEFFELSMATINNNHIEQRDAIADLIYVIIGFAHERGIADMVFGDLEKVHKSNMSKFCKTIDEAIESVNKYGLDGIKTYYRFNEKHNIYVIYRVSDHKILKSINYKPPEFL